MTTVVKYGGTAQDTPQKLEQAMIELVHNVSPTEPLVVVTSAIGKTTNELDDALNNGEDISPILEYHDRYFTALTGDAGNHDTLRQSFTNLRDGYREHKSPSLRATLMVQPERVASLLWSLCLGKVRERNVTWLDFKDPRFPIVARPGERNYLSASVDLMLSQERIKQARELLKDSDIVIPGFGGISNEYEGIVKTLGRGGSDEVAFACGYLFNADQIWICSDVAGIKEAFLEGEYAKETPTVEYLTLEEAKAGAFLGAKLPSEQALMPLEVSHKSGRRPIVYVTHAHNLTGSKTRIGNSTDFNNSNSPAKFVAGTDIKELYTIEGPRQDLLDLESELTEAGIDYAVMIKRGSRIRIGVFGKGSDVANIIMEKYEGKGLSVSYESRLSIVGAVGHGMEDLEGINEIRDTALKNSSINVYSSTDYSDVSICSVVANCHRPQAIAALHEALPEMRALKKLA